VEGEPVNILLLFVYYFSAVVAGIAVGALARVIW
jgi:hypothetical protein